MGGGGGGEGEGKRFEKYVLRLRGEVIKAAPSGHIFGSTPFRGVIMFETRIAHHMRGGIAPSPGGAALIIAPSNHEKSFVKIC